MDSGGCIKALMKVNTNVEKKGSDGSGELSWISGSSGDATSVGEGCGSVVLEADGIGVYVWGGG